MRLVLWIRVILQNLTNNPEMVKIYVVPGSLFLLDFTLRAVLGINLIDTGADMALLAVATFVSLLIEDSKSQRQNGAMVIFIILFLTLWIISLRIVSNQNPMLFLKMDFRPMLSWFVGLTSFVLSGAIANEIIQNSSGRPASP